MEPSSLTAAQPERHIHCRSFTGGLCRTVARLTGGGGSSGISGSRARRRSADQGRAPIIAHAGDTLPSLRINRRGIYVPRDRCAMPTVALAGALLRHVVAGERRSIDRAALDGETRACGAAPARVAAPRRWQDNAKILDRYAKPVAIARGDQNAQMSPS